MKIHGVTQRNVCVSSELEQLVSEPRLPRDTTAGSSGPLLRAGRIPPEVTWVGRRASSATEGWPRLLADAAVGQSIVAAVYQGHIADMLFQSNFTTNYLTARHFPAAYFEEIGVAYAIGGGRAGDGHNAHHNTINETHTGDHILTVEFVTGATADPGAPAAWDSSIIEWWGNTERQPVDDMCGHPFCFAKAKNKIRGTPGAGCRLDQPAPCRFPGHDAIALLGGVAVLPESLHDRPSLKIIALHERNSSAYKSEQVRQKREQLQYCTTQRERRHLHSRT